MITSTKLSSTAFGQPHQKTKQNLNNFGKNISKIKHKSIFSSVLSNQECSKVSLVSYLITMRKHSPSGGKITHSSSKDSSLSNGFTLRTSTISTSMASTTWIMRRWSSPKTAITLIHKLLIKCLRSIKKDLWKDGFSMTLRKWMIDKKIIPAKCMSMFFNNNNNSNIITIRTIISRCPCLFHKSKTLPQASLHHKSNQPWTQWCPFQHKWWDLNKWIRTTQIPEWTF